MFFIKTLHFGGTSVYPIRCNEWIVGCASIISQAVELYFLQSIPVVQVVVVLQQLAMSGIWFLSIFLLIKELYTAPSADSCSEQRWQHGTSSAAVLGHPWIFRGEKACLSFSPFLCLYLNLPLGNWQSEFFVQRQIHCEHPVIFELLYTDCC